MNVLIPDISLREHRRPPSVSSWAMRIEHPGSSRWSWSPSGSLNFASLLHSREQLAYPSQLARCREEVSDSLVHLSASASSLPRGQGYPHLDEGYLDLLPTAPAEPVAFRPGRSAVDSRVLFSGHVRNDLEHPAIADGGIRVVFPGCSSDGIPLAVDVPIGHKDGCYCFSVAIGLGEVDFGQQCALGHRQQMPGEGELGLVALALLSNTIWNFRRPRIDELPTGVFSSDRSRVGLSNAKSNVLRLAATKTN